jgi:hypothetical protein
MRVTKRQLDLLIREALSTPDHMLLEEAELHEIAPIIAAIGGLAARGAAAVGSVFSRGVSGVAKAVTNSPKMMNSVRSLLTKAKGKMPNIDKFLNSLDLEKLDPEMLANALENAPEESKGDLEKIMQNASDEFKKAEECDCPTADELEKAEDSVEE